ncbi:nucleotidyl transferase AbiEii/AbiGii toxin family protein [Bdellovibrio bacteriovorus]|uniref:Nucleotidyltransferase n=1 Tax=Bdellovibrio bacteriovorus str. Tiberius TaxID=1069642 RepID=K7YXA5_BDEBC|nr:nucleotidyl transferase AbiEii/AbiGii toxin family protein [Bdellovibrio bacteriovorus]AFY01355.1 hypothetical protein Bdt_1660 [Bdellovibrio bacteriovorus str. Tiberius]
MLLYQLVDKFQYEKIPFTLVGGYALALHGIVRATMDVDFVLNLKLEDYQKAETALASLGLQPRIPVRAQDIIQFRKEYIEERNLIAWSFVDFKDPSRQVDILITKNLKDLDVVKISVAGRRIPVASLKELLKMKLESNRPQDQIDILRIKEVLNEKK